MRYYMGIDVSKGYSDFVVLDEEKKLVIPAFKLDDTRENHDKLINEIRKIACENDAEICCGLESTGGYENNWYKTLLGESENSNLKVARINPFGVYFSKQADLTKVTTDKVSAEQIARFMINHNEKLRYNQTDLFKAEKKLYNYYQTICKQNAIFKNQLQRILYTSFPELIKFTLNGISDWLLHFLVKYPSPSSLKHTTQETVIDEIPYIKKEYVDYIFKVCKTSVASDDEYLISQITKKLSMKILEINREKKEIINELNKKVDENLVDLLMSIPGIGKQSAIVILLYIGDISRFDSAKKMCSFFGLAPVYSQSGDCIKGKHISKKGSKILRSTLFMVAKSAVHNPYFTGLFDFYKTKNKNYYFAITCVMHKILRIIFGVLKSKIRFDENIDRHYRNIKTVNRKDVCKKYLVGLSENAPVSSREANKRKQELSQNLNNKFNTGSGPCSPFVDKI